MKLSNHIEALLFLSGEPLTMTRLGKILNRGEEEIKKAAEELEEQLKERGLRLIKKEGKIMLATPPDSSKYCEALIKEELNKNLGKAGLETLAIILYKNNVSKNDIDYIRGVNSGFILRGLLIRGLIERRVSPKDKRSYLYFPSIRALQYLGVTKKENLPQYENFVKQIENNVSEFNENN